MLRRLLLLPLLSPLLAALLVGAINPRPLVSLRLLTWRSPALPIGAWVAAAALGGAALSGGATALALRQGPLALRRRTRRGPLEEEPAEPWSGSAWPGSQEWNGRGRRDEGRQEAPTREPPRESAGPGRAPGEPAPTVAVPFRVIRRPAAQAAEGGREPVSRQGERPAQRRAAPPAEAVPVQDDWGTAAAEDW